MHTETGDGDGQAPDNGNGKAMPAALSLLASERPRNVSWFQSSALLFGDWGTSRLYVLGLAFLIAGRSSFWLISAMSVLILMVGWAYTQICRIYADGGGVYTAARQKSKILGVVGALLLFADYTITASLSALDGFHYFKVGHQPPAQVDTGAQGAPPVVHPQWGHEQKDASEKIILPRDPERAHEAHAPHRHANLPWYNDPAVWAIVAILIIGAFNLLGPKHTAGFAIFAAVGMIIITLMIVAFALFGEKIDWSQVDLGRATHPPLKMWQAFASIVLALSGVEAIANLTGVMKRPVYKTAKKAIWAVALEVAAFNILLAIAMCAIRPLPRDAHTADMLAYMAGYYVGGWGEWPVRILGGLLLLSATNTAIGALMGTLYVMSRDRELPALLQKLNGFGSPWVAAVIATLVPATVLVFANEVEKLADLYAIGIVGAVAISTSVCAFHPRLRRWYRKGPMMAIGVLLAAIWVTLALTKPHAVVFVTIVMAVGLLLRAATHYHQTRRPKPSLLRRAILEQLPEGAMAMPKVLLATAGGTTHAEAALKEAKEEGAALVVCFVRDVALNYRVKAEHRLTLDTDPAAAELFGEFLELGHKHGVPIIPVYDTGPNSAELIAENAAIHGAAKVLIGSSRRGTIHRLVKGSFQRKLESLLPPEIPVEVLPVKS
jgi:amino acid transporter/nucleotide-binding universal stress UspA family protein